MKKLLTIVMALFVILSLTGCKPKDPEIVVNKEALAEFYKTVKSSDGRWIEMIQEQNNYIDFYEKDGDYLVDMINFNFDTNTETKKNYEAIDATYNKDTGIYAVKLIEDGMKTVNLILHVDVRKVDKNELSAECVFRDNEIGYYIFEKYGTETQPKEDFYKLIREDQGRWVMGANTTDWYVIFRNENGKHLVSLIEFNQGSLSYKELIYEVKSYANDGDIYTLSLQGNDSLTLHVDTSKASEGIIKCENVHVNEENFEYSFVEKDGMRWYMAEGLEDWGLGVGENLMDRYYPTLRLLPDGGWMLAENVFEGLVWISGSYTEDDAKIVLTVTDGEDLKGHKGYGTKQIVFLKQADGKLVMDTDLCMCFKGLKFHKILY
ncbi:MAG: hypothetical protein IJM15_04990 [Erysipelotrichaceae bacterium]|nr:hypothetical protein [Erysipelotrichaceae bacterium]